MSDITQIVYIVDDDESIRISLSRGLMKHGFEVVTFASAKAFLDVYHADMSGCLVLDYGMPEISGLDLQDHLNAHGYKIPIIFITGHGGVPESVLAMKGGAVDFLEKPFRQDTLVERIQMAMAIDAKARSRASLAVGVRDRVARLTDREREIAALMVQHPAEASSKFIARLLDISPRTVDHHRARILEKLNVRSVAELVDLANKMSLFQDR